MDMDDNTSGEVQRANIFQLSTVPHTQTRRIVNEGCPENG